MPEATKRKVKLSFILLTLVFLFTLVGFSVMYLDAKSLAEENNNRIDDIQKARLNSCRHTYLGIFEVFKPFLPPKPSKHPRHHVRVTPLTKKQYAARLKFENRINVLVKHCNVQVRSSQ
jgi:hypothetical protein